MTDLDKSNYSITRFLQSRFSRKILIMFSSIAITLAIIELVLRVAVCIRSGEFPTIYQPVIRNTNIQRPDPIRNHALQKDVSYLSTGFPPGFEYCTFGQISAQGLNDEIIPLEKIEGEKRILVLGDSFVEAVQVRRRDNLCEVLEQMLNLESQPRVRVINAGVSSYSPILEYLYYREELHQFKPDLVILLLFSNDVFDDYRYNRIGEFDEAGKLLRVPSGEPWITIRMADDPEDDETLQNLFTRGLELMERPFPARYSYLASVIYYRLAARKIRKMSPTPPPNDMFFVLEVDPRYDALKEAGWSLTTKYIRLLKEECAKHDASLFLAAAPIAAQVYGQISYDRFFFDDVPSLADQVELKRIAGELEVRFVDLLNPLRNSGGNLYFPRDGHWTAKAHRVVAGVFHPVILEALEDDR
jgi:hypothetical protein